MDQLSNITMAAALAWASGIRLYAVLFLIGLAGRFSLFGWQPPQAFHVLSNLIVLSATGLLLFIEFFADKIPGLDSLWDAIHTFIRIPAGALLAAGVIGASDGEAWSLAAALLGGSITAGTHFMKAGGRVVINTSPEPASNWTASFTEEAAVLGGLWMAIQHPIVFLSMLLLFLLIAIWVMPKLFRFIVSILKRIAKWFLPPPTTTA